MCVCVQPTAGTEVKVTTCEMWINQKRRYKVPTGQMGLDSVSSWCPCSGPECRNDGQ